MNKGELVVKVADRLGCTKAEATRAVDAVLASILEGVSDDGKATLPGFGTFKKRERKERNGRNPVTKEAIVIPASISLGFTPSGTLKDTL